jgi:hypothetical protein
MATATVYIRPAPWPVGTTVAVYEGSVVTGAPVLTTEVRPDNSVLLLGLTVGVAYIADGSGEDLLFTAGEVIGGGGPAVDQFARDAATAAQNTATSAQTVADAAQPASTALARTLVDAKGDLLVGSGPDTVGRLPVGVNGQVPTADSSQALGIRWATPAAGGGSGGSASLVVAAADAPSAVKARADYVCASGDTANQVQLNAAVAAAASIPGTVVETVGTFTLSDTWLVDFDYLTLMCAGSEFQAGSSFAGSAILRVARPSLLRPANRVNLFGGKFRGLGNGSAGLLGVDFRSYRGVMRETHAQGCLGYGLQIRGYTSAERAGVGGIAWNPVGSAAISCKAYENNLGG